MTSEADKEAFLINYSKDYKEAYNNAQSWGIGGDKSRTLNAVTTAITGALGGQTDLQAAANTLAPYASQLVGKTLGEGQDKNKAAQLAAHAILGATLAYVNGGNPAAGGSAAVASEAAADYLAGRYNDGKTAINPKTGDFDPKLLPEDVKSSIRDMTAAIGAVVGGTVGDSAFNAQIAGVVGKNVIENNTLHMVEKDGTKSYDLPPETQTFNRYEILVGLGIISIDQVPESVYEDVAKLGLKGEKDVTPEKFKTLLAEETNPQKGKYPVDVQDLLSSIPESVGAKWLYADDTITQDHIAYKFAKYGLDGLSNKEIESLSTLMMQYANYRPSLGDKISVENVKNQGLIFALLQAGISEGKVNNSKSADSNRQSSLLGLYDSYNRLFLKDSEIQYQRDGAQRIIDSSISAAAPIVSIGCDAAGGSYHNCTGAGNVAATFTGALGSAFVGKVITPIATSKNEVIVSKAEVTNTKPDINVYPLQTPVKVENILVNPTTGLKEVRPQETVLDTHAKLNQYDQGKLKPAEAATGAQLESVLGSMKKYEGATTTKNPDWEIISGPNKGKTVDAMYTTDKLSQKEIDGLNKYYEKNMTISKSEGERPPEINNIQKHLGKADFVPVDFRVLNEANQKIFLNYVKTLPRYQQEKFIIIKE